LFEGTALAPKSGVSPADRTQSGDNRFTRYLWDDREVKIDPKSLTTITIKRYGKSLSDTAGPDHAQSFDSLTIDATSNAFSLDEKLTEYTNDPSADGTYKWSDHTDSHFTKDAKSLTISFMGLDKDSLNGIGYLLTRTLKSHGADDLTLKEAE
jgi:hypothetical protein